jgi:outer membrane protein OmpA-like peptidoglycan-associated protein
MNFSKKNHKLQPVNMYNMSKKYIIIALLLSGALATSQTSAGEYVIKNISINTEYADFGTSYFGNDSIVFSSPRSKRSIVKNIWLPNSQPYLDLYIGSIENNGEIAGKHKVKGNVNTKFHEATVAFTKDRKIVYFTSNNYYHNEVKNDTTGVLRLQLFKASVQKDGEWTDIEKLPFNSDEYSTGHPALSQDGKKLYFVSDRPGSFGKTDIYVVDIKEDGTYGEPKNLGAPVNTKGKEMFPFIDGDIIYFSSDRENGLGGLDIYASKMYNTTISKPLNLGVPINSPNDDFAFIKKQDKGYFSSNRKEGVGDDDIYSFLTNKPLEIECTQEISGLVKNKETQENLSGVEIKLLDKEGNIVKTVMSDENGLYRFTVKCNTTYKISGDKVDFQDDNAAITTVNDIVEKPIEVALALAPEIVENKINIENIYFDLDKWNIRPDAAAELDKLVQIMKDHPELNVEAGSHTDSRATEAYNNRLSKRRAKATVKYIVSKGIDAKRITAKGYGETQLTNGCTDDVECTDEQHQMNRRTEFVIVSDKKEDDTK